MIINQSSRILLDPPRGGFDQFDAQFEGFFALFDRNKFTLRYPINCERDETGNSADFEEYRHSTLLPKNVSELKH